MPDPTPAQQGTVTLRAMWTHSAAKVLEGIRNGEEVDAAEVLKLQATLEAIEGREEIDRVNAIARGPKRRRKR